jgi:hypothetical protein
MKRYKLIAYIFFLLPFNICIAQQVGDAGDYLTAIATAQVEMNSKYMQYMSTAAHRLKQKNVESLRRDVLASITNSQLKTTALPTYGGDNNLRQKSIDYIQLCYNIFNNDFGQIVNMKEVEEQSIDDMQKTILIQEKAAEKLIEASLAMTNATLGFAKKYNVQFTSQRDKLTEKLATAARLNHYVNDIFLLFFKCNWQDNEINRAITAKKVNDIEQGRSALRQYAVEGIRAVDGMKNYEGDPSLKYSCKETLSFYKRLAENEIRQLTDFYLVEENFDKIKKDFEKTVKHSKAEVFAYNAQVKNYNAAVTRFNQINNFIISNRRLVLNNFNSTEKIFTDTHMPHFNPKDQKRSSMP